MCYKYRIFFKNKELRNSDRIYVDSIDAYIGVYLDKYCRTVRKSFNNINRLKIVYY